MISLRKNERHSIFFLIKKKPKFIAVLLLSFQFWIGLKWDPVQQNFFWIDDTLLTWSHWCFEGQTNSDEPDCMTSSSRFCNSIFEPQQDCVRLTHYQQSTWCFATRPCSGTYNTMCRGCK